MNCKHHWVIETPNGAPILKGNCKFCGAKRQWSTAGESDPTTVRLGLAVNAKRAR